jgi:predicted HTH transcriptional regulator
MNKALEKVVARTIAAFMNSQGGTLIIGVSDEGEARGLEADFETLHQRPNADGWEQHFRNVLNNHLSKPVAALVGLSFSEFQGKTVAVVRAERSINPAFLTDGPTTEFHVRSGNTTHTLNVQETADYIHQHFPSVA